MSELLRESLEAVGAELTDSTSVETEAPAADTSSGTNSTESGSIASTSSTPTPSEGRDEKGRFAPKATAGNSPGQAAPAADPPPQTGAASSTPPPAATEPAKTEPPKPGEPDTTHAPQSWPIGARQTWDQVPPAVRQLIHQRELQTQQALSRSAPDRQLAGEVRNLVAPIARAIEARGTTPQKLIASYVQFDQALTSRDPATQAHAIAQVIKGYGIPIEALADAIDGKLQPGQRQPTIEEIREQVRAEENAKWQQQRQQQEFQSHNNTVREFAKKADPVLFNDDVRHDMAALIEGAAARGVELSLQDAYDRAIRANPEAWAIVQQREQAKAAATQQRATQRSEAAASSIRGRPASPVGGEGKGNSLRADLEAAAASASGRT